MAAESEVSDWEELIACGYRAYLAGDSYAAEQAFKAALANAALAKVQVHPNIGLLFFLLGELYSEAQFYAEAESCYRYALLVYDGLSAADDIDMCIILKRLADTCRVQGKTAEANALSKRDEELLAPTRMQLESIFQRSA